MIRRFTARRSLRPLTSSLAVLTALAGTMAFGATAASAADYTWNGATDTAWNQAGNWLVDGDPAVAPPTAGDSVSIPSCDTDAGNISITGVPTIALAFLSIEDAFPCNPQALAGAGSTITSESIQLTGGEFTDINLTVPTDGGGSFYQTFAGDSTTFVDSALTLSGGTFVNVFGAVALEGDSPVVANGSTTFYADSGIVHEDAGTLVSGPEAFLRVDASNQLDPEDPAFDPDYDPLAHPIDLSSIAVTNRGSLHVASGRLAVASLTQAADSPDASTSFSPNTELAGNVTVNDGRLDGSGEIDGNLTLAGNSIVGPSVEDDFLTPGTLAVSGNATFGPDTTLRVSLHEAGSDRLAVGGTAALAGSLVGWVDPDYVPATGTTFTPLTYGAATGAFARIDQQMFPSVPAAYVAPTQGATALTLTERKAATSLGATSAVQGGTFAVSGTGFLPGETVRIVFGQSEAAFSVVTPVADGTGAFTASVPVPAATPVGANALYAEGLTSEAFLWQDVTITAAAVVVTPPPASPPADTTAPVAGKVALKKVVAAAIAIKKGITNNHTGLEAGSKVADRYQVSKKDAKRLGLGTKPANLVLGSGTGTANAGGVAKVTVKLNKKAKAALSAPQAKKQAALPVTLVTVVSDAAGNKTTTTRKQTIKLPARKR